MKSLLVRIGKPFFLTEFFDIFNGLRKKPFLCHFPDNEKVNKALLWLYQKINPGKFSQAEKVALTEVMKESKWKNTSETLILFNDIKRQLTELE